MTKEEFESLMQYTEGSYEGIGIYKTTGDDNNNSITNIGYTCRKCGIENR